MTKDVKKAMMMSVITVVVIVLVVLLVGTIDKTNNKYTVEGTIVTTMSDGYCVVVDTDGEKWELYATDVECGDNVVLVIDDMSTHTIHDDRVVGLVVE